MPRPLRAFIISGLAVCLPSALQAQSATISEGLAAVKAAVAERDFPTAWELCHAILKAADVRDAAALTGRELYAVGLAHYYLVAEAFDKALAAGSLKPEEAQFAREMRDHIMAPPPDVKVISHGEKVNLEEYLAEGKTTIVDFFSDYCGPCRQLSPILEQLVSTRTDMALVKVDINRPAVEGIDWGSPVARQFDLNSIPYIMIFGPDKNLIAKGDEARHLIQQWTGQ